MSSRCYMDASTTPGEVASQAPGYALYPPPHSSRRLQ